MKSESLNEKKGERRRGVLTAVAGIEREEEVKGCIFPTPPSFFPSGSKSAVEERRNSLRNRCCDHGQGEWGERLTHCDKQNSTGGRQGLYPAPGRQYYFMSRLSTNSNLPQLTSFK